MNAVAVGREVFLIDRVRDDRYEDEEEDDVSEEDYDSDQAGGRPEDDGDIEEGGYKSTFAMASGNPDRYHEEDTVGEDYDSDDYEEIEGPDYDPRFDRMVGAICAMPVSWDDDAASFSEDDDPEDMKEEAVFPSMVGVLA